MWFSTDNVCAFVLVRMPVRLNIGFLLTGYESHHCYSLQVPQEMIAQSRNSYVEAEVLAPPLDDLCKQLQPNMEEEDEEEDEEEEEGSYRLHMEGLIQNLLKEARDKAKCWASQPTIDNVELAYKKVRFASVQLYCLS